MLQVEAVCKHQAQRALSALESGADLHCLMVPHLLALARARHLGDRNQASGGHIMPIQMMSCQHSMMGPLTSGHSFSDVLATFPIGCVQLLKSHLAAIPQAWARGYLCRLANGREMI